MNKLKHFGFFIALTLLLFVSDFTCSDFSFESFQLKQAENFNNKDIKDVDLPNIMEILNESNNIEKISILKAKVKTVPDETITYKSEATEESKEMDKLAKIALTAAKKIAVLYESNTDYKKLYPDLWKFISKVKLPHPYCPKLKEIKCDPEYPFRTLDGSCNNLKYPWWGKHMTPYQRVIEPHYHDSFSYPRIMSVNKEDTLPSARLVAIKTLNPDPIESNVSMLFTTFGQFLAHDISLAVDNGANCSCRVNNEECFNIPVPEGDEKYKGVECIPFKRSAASLQFFDCFLGPREQINKVTHFIDGSQIYGSTAKDNKELRLGYRGLLKSSMIPGSPFESIPLIDTKGGCPISKRFDCFFAGDKRLDENTYLTCLHSIFLRRHNKIARKLSQLNPHWNDETTFQETRAIVIGQMQHIIYNEWLPLLLGHNLMKKFSLYSEDEGYSYKYNEKLYPALINSFAAASFRLHSLVHNEVTKATRYLEPYEPKLLENAILNATDAYEHMDDICRGTLIEVTYKHHFQMAESLHDNLFKDAFVKNSKASLSSMNIQRGRDHGLPPYNKVRKLCGLKVAKTFDDLLEDIDEFQVNRLKEVYKSVGDIDLYMGGASENKLPDSFQGPTFSCINAYQFHILKHADRFWYENGKNELMIFTPEQLEQIRKTTLSGILCDSLVLEKIQKNAFFLWDEEKNPYVKCSSFNFMDLNLWKEKNNNDKKIYRHRIHNYPHKEHDYQYKKSVSRPYYKEHIYYDGHDNTEQRRYYEDHRPPHTSPHYPFYNPYHEKRGENCIINQQHMKPKHEIKNVVGMKKVDEPEEGNLNKKPKLIDKEKNEGKEKKNVKQNESNNKVFSRDMKDHKSTNNKIGKPGSEKEKDENGKYNHDLKIDETIANIMKKFKDFGEKGYLNNDNCLWVQEDGEWIKKSINNGKSYA